MKKTARESHPPAERARELVKLDQKRRGVAIRLGELEAAIGRGVADVGVALLEIRDKRLYREEFRTFETYCSTRWGWQRAHAYRMIDAAKVAGLLSPTGDAPATESQARELTPLLREDEQLVGEVWKEVKEEHGEDVTASIVRQHVSERLGRATALPIADVLDDATSFECLLAQARDGLKGRTINEFPKSRRNFILQVTQDLGEAVLGFVAGVDHLPSRIEGQVIRSDRLFEIFSCPECGHEGEKPVFRERADRE